MTSVGEAPMAARRSAAPSGISSNWSRSSPSGTTAVCAAGATAKRVTMSCRCRGKMVMMTSDNRDIVRSTSRTRRFTNGEK